MVGAKGIKWRKRIMTKEDRCLSRLAIFARYKTFLECGTGKPGGQGQNEKRRSEELERRHGRYLLENDQETSPTISNAGTDFYYVRYVAASP